MKPDKRLTVEILLSSYGFLLAFDLSTALVALAHRLQTELGADFQFNLSWMERVVSLSAHLLQTYFQSEETLEVH